MTGTGCQAIETHKIYDEYRQAVPKYCDEILGNAEFAFNSVQFNSARFVRTVLTCNALRDSLTRNKTPASFNVVAGNPYMMVALMVYITNPPYKSPPKEMLEAYYNTIPDPGPGNPTQAALN